MVNDYDKYAAQRQKELRRGGKFSHRFVEKPAMRSLLPDLRGKKVLLLGCGTAEEVLLLEEFGAASMTGVDLSAESIRLADETYPSHVFKVGDMHALEFQDQSFDFVYSSLTVHYSEKPLEVYKEIVRVLRPGGTFQFSVGHPMRWASERVMLDAVSTKLMGYTEGDTPPRLYGSYSDFRQYDETFPSGETLRFWVGPPSMHFGLLRQAGLEVTDFVETKAIEETKQVDERYYERFSHFPQFVIFVAKKSE
ncbi:methyltransferase domain-containing protein [Streptomyces caniscabiei]|uniref:class I SAM-dependent methyltransferase n=1 Tax=Streptomyces caniscabiei TaxID=2746961 RepID=UPI0029AB7559|nr:methyltransferase domain-containing protein [Streptomyces caniscabiei]MDX2776639.1 methyltransferase domain-containing protein [Streptomyces caniscabiei]